MNKEFDFLVYSESDKDIKVNAVISKMETIQLEGNRQIIRLYVKPVYFLYFELFGISEQLPI